MRIRLAWKIVNNPDRYSPGRVYKAGQMIGRRRQQERFGQRKFENWLMSLPLVKS